MIEVEKEVLSKSKYNDPKVTDLRLRIQSLRIALAEREYSYNLLCKELDDCQEKYREMLGYNKEGKLQ